MTSHLAAADRPVFIHINKTAGTSIARSAGDAIVSAGHRFAERWIAEHGRSGPLFSVVRDPYERVRSEYTYRRTRWERGERNPHLANLHLPFDDWVRETYAGEAFRTRSFFERAGVGFSEFNMVDDVLIWFHSQRRWLSDADGRMLVDEVLRFERLDEDWAEFCRRHEIDAPLGHDNASPMSPEVEQRFTPEVRAVIARYYADDFETFGYAS